MPSTYSPSLGIQLIPNGDQSGTWGTTTNTNWDLVDEAVAGVVLITMTNTNYTLSSLDGISDEARNMVIVATGSLSSTYQIVAPLVSKIYIVANNTSGGQSITVGGSSGAVVTIPNSYATLVYCDGNDFYPALTTSSDDFRVLGALSVTGATTLAGSLAVSGNTTLSGTLSVTGSTNIVPVGTTILFPSITPPTGFLLCNGQAVSRGTYATLFALVGTTFGPGDNVTTFNLPSINQVVPNVYYMIKY